jgi:RNA polymerase sigma-70 factor, ECF subfamily
MVPPSIEDMTSDSDLALSFKNGNKDAFDELYIRHLKGIFAFVFYRVMDRMTAEDLTSQTFIKALEHMHSYNPNKGAFSTWLYRIARNTVHDHFRTTRPSTNIDDVWDLAADENPFLDASSSMDARQVRDVLSTLPKDKRDVLVMRLWDGLSYKEIADLTGKSEASCKMSFSRTVADLRSQMSASAFILLALSRHIL